MATNVKKTNGQRAIGTFIPAIEPDGKSNKVVSSLLRGETYRGRSFVVNAWYHTAYEPLRNESQRVVGAIYVGVPQESVPGLRQAVVGLRVGDHGRAFVLDTQANMVVSPNDGPDGELLPERDAEEAR